MTTTMLTFVVSFCVTCGFFWLVIREFNKKLAVQKAVLNEIQECLSDMSESIALLEYGALNEAVDISQRWVSRAKGLDVIIGAKPKSTTSSGAAA